MAENNKNIEETMQTTEKETVETVKVNRKANPKHPAKVKIKIPLTRTEKDDVLVALNGKTYQIKRGHEVEVPWGVAKILERKEKQLLIAMEYEAMAAQGLEGLEKN